MGRKLSVIKVTVRKKIVDSVSNGTLFFLKAKQSGLRPFPASEKHEKCCRGQHVSTNNILLLTVNLAVLSSGSISAVSRVRSLILRGMSAGSFDRTAAGNRAYTELVSVFLIG